MEWAADTLVLPALNQPIIDARLTTVAGAVSLEQDDEAVRVFVPQAQRDSIDTIIELTVDDPILELAVPEPEAASPG